MACYKGLSEKQKKKPEVNAISAASPGTNSIRLTKNPLVTPKPKSYFSVSSVTDGRSHRDVLSSKPKSEESESLKMPIIAIVLKLEGSEGAWDSVKSKPPPMVSTIPINGAPAKTLLIPGTHLANVNRISICKDMVIDVPARKVHF